MQTFEIGFNGETNCDTRATSCRYLLDTLGAVAVDYDGNFGEVVSSCGIMLKHRGRLGQAAAPGAGCWVQDSTASTTTDVGEYLTATLFAKKFHDKLQIARLLHDLGQSNEQLNVQCANQAPLLVVREAMNQCFKDLLDSPALGHVPLSERLAGMLTVSLLQTNLTSSINPVHNQPGRRPVVNREFKFLSYGHNTRTLCWLHDCCCVIC
jgi:hypothetical protein